MDKIDELIKREFELWDEIHKDERTWIAYESRRKAILDELAFKKETEMREQKAYEEAYEEGKVLAKKMVAKNMLTMKMDMHFIADILDLSMEELEKLAEEVE